MIYYLFFSNLDYCWTLRDSLAALETTLWTDRQIIQTRLLHDEIALRESKKMFGKWGPNFCVLVFFGLSPVVVCCNP